MHVDSSGKQQDVTQSHRQAGQVSAWYSSHVFVMSNSAQQCSPQSYVILGKHTFICRSNNPVLLRVWSSLCLASHSFVHRSTVFVKLFTCGVHVRSMSHGIDLVCARY